MNAEISCSEKAATSELSAIQAEERAEYEELAALEHGGLGLAAGLAMIVAAVAVGGGGASVDKVAVVATAAGTGVTRAELAAGNGGEGLMEVVPGAAMEGSSCEASAMTPEAAAEIAVALLADG